MNIRQLWKLSGTIHTEIFLQSTLANAGNQRERVLSKYKDNIKNIHSSALYGQLFSAAILFVPAVIVISSFNKALEISDSISSQKFFFNNSLAISFNYLFELVFMLIFVMMSLAHLLEGKSFRFLHQFPLNHQELQILGFMTFLRLILYQLLVMLFVLPFGIFIVTGSIWLFLVSFVINTINVVIICFFLLILISKMSQALFDQKSKLNIKTFLKYIILIVYMLTLFSIYTLIGKISQYLTLMYEVDLFSPKTLTIFNTFLPLIPFPFSSGYLLSILIAGELPDSVILLSMGVGLLLFTFLLYCLLKRGNQILLKIGFQREKAKESESYEISREDFIVKSEKPLSAYLRIKSKIIVRDNSSLMTVTMALLFPLIPLLQGTAGNNLFVTFISYSGFIIIFSNHAIANTDGIIGNILSSLPIGQRTVLRGRNILTGAIFLISYLLLNIITLGKYLGIKELILTLLLALFLPNLFQICKALLFGRVNNKYTLFNLENFNFLQNLILMVPLFAFIGLESGLVYLAPYFLDSTHILWIIIFGVNLALFLLLEFVNRKMFPY